MRIRYCTMSSLLRNQRNISSMGGKMYTSFGGWYHTTKFAVEALSDCMRLETEQFGVDVVLVEPGMALNFLIGYSDANAFSRAFRSWTGMTLGNYRRKLGAEVEWDNSSRTVTGRKDATTIVLTIGSRSPTINGTPVQLDVPGTIVSGRTMVSARFISESLGASVDWVEETRTVVIISDGLTKVSEEIYFGYSTDDYSLNFRGGGEFSEFLESIEIFKK